MTDDPATLSWSLSPAQAQLIDRMCDDFEAAWKTGQRPNLDQYLEDTPEPERSALLVELLAVELSYRKRHRELPTLEEYHARYPGHSAAITAAFRKAEPPSAQAAPDSAGETPSPLPSVVAGGEPTTLPLPSAMIPAADWPTIPGYAIQRQFEPGGMGVVFQALQRPLGRTVALKMMKAGLLASSLDRERFHQEARAVAQLNHPHIVQIYDYGEYNQLPFFSMEFIAGGTLAGKLNGTPLPPRQAAGLVELLARAMAYVHRQSIIHRDLKPANILLEKGVDALAGPPSGNHWCLGLESYLPKIADFGLVKFLNEVGPSITGLAMGTASYMAPEQAEGRNREVNAAADIYALGGAILYELLTGLPPFRGPTREIILFKVLSEDPEPPTRLQPDTPAELETICLKCLEKEPAQRYDSADALAEDLRRFLAGEPISIAPQGEWEWREKWARRVGYELLDVLTAGVRDVIYKARDVNLQQVVAFKVLTGIADSDPAEMARFRDEAQVVARLRHPNIVQIYTFAEHNNRAYCAMEHVDGGSLIEKFADAPAPLRQAAELVATLAQAIHFAHQRGIVHCALKPSNIVLTADGIPKITNFGLAVLLEKEQQETLRSMAFRRLPSYMAPELAEGRMLEIGPATDIYALGGILYKLLTGGPPFLGDTIDDTLAQVRFAEPVPPRFTRPVPYDLEMICLKCLHKEPAKRYASADELAQELRRFLLRIDTDPDMDLVQGYEVLEELGRGGLGIVHKARHIGLDQLMALKIFHRLEPARLQRIRAASQAVARLKHPNILQIHDCGERDGRLYVAAELVQGSNLAQKNAGLPWPPREAAALVETLARGIHYAHECGLVHRNLKPSVVLLTADNIPKISGFELARLLTQELDESEGSLLGTPTYMAPEQAQGKVKEVGPAADVHGLGSLLYELLTGRPPFQGETIFELLHQIGEREPELPSRLQPGVPAKLDAICRRCLQKDPDHRYRSALALAEELHRFQAPPSLAVRIWDRLRQLLQPGSP